MAERLLEEWPRGYLRNGREVIRGMAERLFEEWPRGYLRNGREVI
jgi:hypothetical protein